MDDNGDWEYVLHEYMVHDEKTNKFYVLANSRGKISRGIGEATSKNTLRFEDYDMSGTKVLTVEFEFLDQDSFQLTGFDTSNKKLWSFGYSRIDNLNIALKH